MGDQAEDTKEQTSQAAAQVDDDYGWENLKAEKLFAALLISELNGLNSIIAAMLPCLHALRSYFCCNPKHLPQLVE